MDENTPLVLEDVGLTLPSAAGPVEILRNLNLTLSRGERVSLATVYNTLNQFRDAGLLREVVVAPGRSYFDTNIGHHHHFFVETDGELHDFPSDSVRIDGLPSPPNGTTLSRVDVIVRVRR